MGQNPVTALVSHDLSVDYRHFVTPSVRGFKRSCRCFSTTWRGAVSSQALETKRIGSTWPLKVKLLWGLWLFVNKSVCEILWNWPTLSLSPCPADCTLAYVYLLHFSALRKLCVKMNPIWQKPSRILMSGSTATIKIYMNCCLLTFACLNGCLQIS